MASSSHNRSTSASDSVEVDAGALRKTEELLSALHESCIDSSRDLATRHHAITWYLRTLQQFVADEMRIFMEMDEGIAIKARSQHPTGSSPAGSTSDTVGSPVDSVRADRPDAADTEPADAGPETVETYYQAYRRENEAFSRLLPGLLQSDAGLFVAVLDGEVVDRDSDRFGLSKRIREAHGGTFVLIREVATEGVEVYHMDSPQELRS